MKQNIRISMTEANQGVLNFSHLLDAPAGKHGFVRVKDGHFMFEDGTRAKFLGFNIATRSNTPTHEDAERLAERFASMGVNVIRMHAADCPPGDGVGNWSSSRKTPLLDYSRGTTRFFHPEGLDRFDYLAAKLKEKGIYLHVDLLVARDFLEGDGLDYPGGFPLCTKRYPVYNERLIQLQKEYAKAYLCHVNPYTGLAPVDDPAVITVQMTNEESAIKGNPGTEGDKRLDPYRDEVQQRFNEFLLMKYFTRERLAEAWTLDGVCALGDDEDPKEGTVRVIEGGFYQPANEPMGPWDAPDGPARYADFMEFGTWQNRRFYQEMKDYLISLGVKVPIAASNLIAGAADVYGHTDGDLMENNTYFNHPMLPVQDGAYMAYGPTEYVSANPLTMQQGAGSMATSLLSLGSVAVVHGKPFMITEWNEYGLHPFHSTAFVQTVAYACLNDWDGLILYNHHTTETPDAEPADEIVTVFDSFNDPALISQWGFMATLFLKGAVSPAKSKTDLVFTQNDWKTNPNFGWMPTCFFPYVSSMRSVYLDGGGRYEGSADVAVNAGFLNGGDLRDAAHSVYYAWSPYRDAKRRCLDTSRLAEAAKGGRTIQEGVHLSEQALVLDQIAELSHMGDYRELAAIFTKAMQEWGVLEEGTGYVDGKLISDTRELIFDPDHARFVIRNANCGYFSGAPEEETALSDRVSVRAANERISLALLPLDAETLRGAKSFLLTAVGNTGTDAQSFAPGPEMMPGLSFTMIRMDGKLYAETLEGSLFVKAGSAKLTALDPAGNPLGEILGEQREDGVYFNMLGDLPGIQYHLIGHPFSMQQGALFGMDVTDPALKTPQDFAEYAACGHLLKNMMPMLAEAYGTSRLQAVSAETDPGSLHPEDDPLCADAAVMDFGSFRVSARFHGLWDPRSDGALLCLQESDTVCWLVGNACGITLSSQDPEAPNLDLLSAEEGCFEEDRWVPGRRLNGDETASMTMEKPSVWKLTFLTYA